MVEKRPYLYRCFDREKARYGQYAAAENAT